MKIIKLPTMLWLTGLLLSACAVTPAGSVSNPAVSANHSQDYSIVLHPATPVTVKETRVYREGDHLMVSGKVMRMHKVHLPGQMVLTVCAQDGTPLSRETKRMAGLESARKGRMELPFRFRLEALPPEGAMIFLKYRARTAHNLEPGCSKS